jgi:hypothetical protein
VERKTLMDAAEFLLKLGKERNAEARAFINLKSPEEAKVLLDEADKLATAFDVVMIELQRQP